MKRDMARVLVWKMGETRENEAEKGDTVPPSRDSYRMQLRLPKRDELCREEKIH